MKNFHDSTQQAQHSSHPIPDVEIIDLDDAGTESPLSPEAEHAPEVYAEPDAEAKAKGFRINMHIVLLAVVLIFIAGIIYKVMNWGVFIDLDEIFRDGQGTYDDTYDEILPLLDANGETVIPDYSDGLTIVAFGNAPFADDRDSEDSLANLIAKESGATVYNCSVSGSYLASRNRDLNVNDTPMDVYTFYWLAMLAGKADITGHFTGALETMGADAPPDAQEAYNLLTSIDFNEVDVITVMYDATDYFMGSKMADWGNPTDVTQFSGNLEAGIEILQLTYPHIRIIVMGPPYAYAIDENGDYISSDIQRYGQDVLSVYSIMEWNSCASRSVTFIDHLYGTITEDNAKHYLADNLHLNKAGRKKIAERFMYALNYYNSTTE